MKMYDYENDPEVLKIAQEAHRLDKIQEDLSFQASSARHQWIEKKNELATLIARKSGVEVGDIVTCESWNRSRKYRFFVHYIYLMAGDVMVAGRLNQKNHRSPRRSCKITEIIKIEKQEKTS